MCLLSERRLAKAEPPSPPHSTAVAEFLGGGVKQKSDSGRGQACSKFQHDGGLPDLLSTFWAFQNHRSLRYRTQGAVIMLSRALLLAGLELPCDAARLQSKSSTKRGERRGGIASGPAVDAGLLLLLVGVEPGAGLPPTLVEVCRVRHGPLLLGICRGLRCVTVRYPKLDPRGLKLTQGLYRQFDTKGVLN